MNENNLNLLFKGTVPRLNNPLLLHIKALIKGDGDINFLALKIVV